MMKRHTVCTILFLLPLIVLNLVVRKDNILPRALASLSHDAAAPITKLEPSDLILQQGRWSNPIVVKDYKLVFFIIPKVACTEWILLCRRMLGLPDGERRIHDPQYNGLTYLTNFTLEEAQEMLTSDEWTRAIFVREPKERVLSAFLDKFANFASHFGERCCDNQFKYNEEDRKFCRSRTSTMDFTYFLNCTLDCPDPHWTPQADAVDDKWWPYMTFVGYMNSAATDAERLLRSLRREGSTLTAWDEYGATGWGKDGADAFMKKVTNSMHPTNAHDKLQKVYTKCQEAFVEKYWAKEWNHPTYHFEMTHMFDHTDLSDCEIH